MDRPALLAVPTLCVAAVVVPLRSLSTFRFVRETFGLTVLTLSSKLLWTVVAVVGFATVGYAYGSAASEDPPSVLGVGAIAAFFGALVGNLALWSLPHTTLITDSVYLEALTIGVYAFLDALLFGLLVVGGYALSTGGRNG
jgi:hypothetical protein